MIKQITIKARIFKHDPSSGQPPRYEDVEVTGPSSMRVLEVLRDVYERQGDLAFNYACRIGRCGTCAVRLNGRPVLACQEKVQDGMTIGPLTPFPVIRDLVVDRSEAEAIYADLHLAPQRATPHPGRREVVDLDTTRKVGLMGTCIGCQICVAGCPAVDERAFIGPAFMLQLRRLAEHPADTGERLQQALEGGMVECFACDACYQLCPSDLSPADAIRDFRQDLVWGGKAKRK